MAAARIVLDRSSKPTSYPPATGFQPGDRRTSALETSAARPGIEKATWVLDADIRSCFDEIDHDALLEQIERRVCDRRLLKLLPVSGRRFEGGIVSAIEAGTPQGSPLSPLLANVALRVLDQAWQGGGQRLGVLVKYADDLVILTATRAQAESSELVAVLDGLGLRLPPEKKAHLAKGAEGFTFLGFEHRMRESWPGRWYLQKWLSRRAMASVKALTRTERRYARLPVEWAVEDLNRVLRGWATTSATETPDNCCASTNASPSSASANTGSRPKLGHPLQPSSVTELGVLSA